MEPDFTPVIYLSGVIKHDLVGNGTIGFILTPRGNHSPSWTSNIWAADTGCFASPHEFNLTRYYVWLDKHRRDTCLFATAPDVVGSFAETMERSTPVLPIIRDLGYKAALVAQDGWDSTLVDWDAFDCIFIGGSTPFKLTSEAIAAEAKARGKWLHMGRVNSLRRLRYAQHIGCDSADGTTLAFGPDKYMPSVKRWLHALEAQPALL